MIPVMDRTPWNPDWSAAIERVTSLVESIFACRVKFQTLETFLDRSKQKTNLSLGPVFQEQDLVFLESTLFEPPEMIRGLNPGSFAFPLRVRRAGAGPTDVSLVGVAIIEGLAASDDDRLQMLGEFLHMSVESRLNAFERLLDVEQRERTQLERSTNTLSDVRDESKIIHLFPRKAAEAVEVADPYLLHSYTDELLLQKPILIIARGDSEAASKSLPYNRIALEIFNRTSLWFFVNISDLSEDAFQSAQSFRDLGRMCVFVPDLAALSIEKQLRLAEVFGEAADGDAPRLITVVHDNPTTLVGNGTLLPHLLALLMPYELESNVVTSGDLSPRSLRTIVQNIEAGLKIPSVVNRDPETKASNLIHLLGRWRQDEGSNPTFH